MQLHTSEAVSYMFFTPPFKQEVTFIQPPQSEWFGGINVYVKVSHVLSYIFEHPPLPKDVKGGELTIKTTFRGDVPPSM